jgi:hypothetical protein
MVHWEWWVNCAIYLHLTATHHMRSGMKFSNWCYQVVIKSALKNFWLLHFRFLDSICIINFSHCSRQRWLYLTFHWKFIITISLLSIDVCTYHIESKWPEATVFSPLAKNKWYHICEEDKRNCKTKWSNNLKIIQIVA